MSEFVEECRREWKRLGVPDEIADEMAGELAADLGEAASEGASAEEVLGSSALDPRSLAASWATERGLVHPRPSERRLSRRPLALAALVTLAFLAVIGAAAAILASDTGQRGALRFLAIPPSDQRIVIQVEAPPPPAGDSVDLAPPPHTGDNLDPIAWILLAVGVIGIIPSSLLWASWVRTRPPVAPA